MKIKIDEQRELLTQLARVLAEIDALQLSVPFLPAVRVHMLRGVRSWVVAFLRGSGGDVDELASLSTNADEKREELRLWWAKRRREWDS